MPGPHEGSERLAVPPPPRAHSLRKCLGEVCVHNTRERKAGQDKSVQLRGPLTRKEVEYLKVAGKAPQVFPGLTQIPQHLRQVTGPQGP